MQTRTTATRTTQSGIGDILLQGRYYILDEQGLLPTVALLARIKFPTADRDRGLGTGEFDEKFGIQLSKTLTQKSSRVRRTIRWLRIFKRILCQNWPTGGRGLNTGSNQK